ncbi:synapse-associated protein 1-like [Diadema antillarum]|uniref:synapse-associated protein 1-like n=1 Tax=Diadema antillarum TaxID=105358 RepID=UPI003A89EF56
MEMLSSWWGGKKTIEESSKAADKPSAESDSDKLADSVNDDDAALETGHGTANSEPAVADLAGSDGGDPSAAPDSKSCSSGEDGNTTSGTDRDKDTAVDSERPERKNTSATATKMARITKEEAAEAAEAALNSAYNFGSFLFKKVSDTATKTATLIQKTMEEQTIVGDFQKEQEKFMKEKHSKRSEVALPPWVGYNEEEQMKEQILALSQDKRNFLRNPPAGVQFHFEFTAVHPIAMATLQEDNNLRKMRFELVPKKITEENFWRNYFYRVSLIKQSSQLTSLAAKSGDGRKGSGSASHSSDEGSSQKGDKTPPTDAKSAQSLPSKPAKGADEDEEQLEIDRPDSPPGSEFISDAFNSELDEADLKKGMEQLGMDKKDEEVTEDVPEWEKELQQELQDYEVVEEGEENEEWEREINQMLEDEAGME